MGDTVTLTVNGTNYTGTVAAGYTFSMTSAGADCAAPTHRQCEHHFDRCRGQRRQRGDSETYTVDVTAPTPTMTLTSSITADDIINAAEAGGTVAVTGAVAARGGRHRYAEGQRMNYTGTVAAGNTFSINVPGAQLVADADFIVQASVTRRCGGQRRHRRRYGELYG